MQVPPVRSEAFIASGIGGLPQVLQTEDRFGYDATPIGDLDGNGHIDLAVGAPAQGTSRSGAVWILLMGGSGSVIDWREISASTTPSLGLVPDDQFGTSVEAVDLDGQGPAELLVGRPGYGGSGGGARGGAVLLFLDPVTWTVASHFDIDHDTVGMPSSAIRQTDGFGTDLTTLESLPGSGATLAVGIMSANPMARGALVTVEVLWNGGFPALGVVNRIDHTDLPASASNQIGFGDRFGFSVAALGDLDGPGGAAHYLAVGAPYSDQGQCFSQPPVGACDIGRAWVLALDSNQGILAAHAILPELLPATIEEDARFGSSLSWLDAPSSSAPGTLMVGAPSDQSATADPGSVHMLELTASHQAGTYTITTGQHLEISVTSGLFCGEIEPGDRFGSGLSFAGDLDQDGQVDYVVGAPGDDTGGSDSGGLYVIYPGDRFTFHQGCSVDGVSPCDNSAPFLCRNPPMSLVHVSGEPRVGETMQFALISPTTCAGARLLVYASPQPDANFAFTQGVCGTALPGWGYQSSALPLGGPDIPGGLMIDMNGAVLVGSAVGAFPEGGFIDVHIPADPNLACEKVYLQGLILDGSNNACGHTGTSTLPNEWPTWWAPRALTGMVEFTVAP